MRDRLSEAIAVVSGRCRVAASDVVRMDVDRQGTLHACVAASMGLRWFRIDDRGCHELRPEEDALLPLAADLPRLQQTGHVEVLAWRPGRRLVVRLIRDGSSLVMKGHRARRSEAAARCHRLGSRGLDSGTVRAAELVAHDAPSASLVFKHVSGRPLALGSAAQERFFKIGAALRAWQHVELSSEERSWLPEHGPTNELAVIDDLASRLERVASRLPANWRSLRANLGGVMPPDVPGVVTHRDLHDGQFLQLESGLVLFDFDLLCLSDPLLDAANLLAHVKLRAMQGVPSTTAESALLLGRALLDGLDRDAEPDFGPRLRFYQASTFLRLALIHRLRPGWEHLTDPLTRLTERCIDELARA